MQTIDKAKFHIILVQAVVVKDGRVLLAQRSLSELQSPGLWSLPGGKVELYGDDSDVIEKTLVAECGEEVGIVVGAEMEYLASASFVRKDGTSVVSLTFMADWKSGEAQALEETIGVAWVSESEVAGYDLAPNIKEKLEMAFAVIEK